VSPNSPRSLVYKRPDIESFIASRVAHVKMYLTTNLEINTSLVYSMFESPSAKRWRRVKLKEVEEYDKEFKIAQEQVNIKVCILQSNFTHPKRLV